LRFKLETAPAEPGQEVSQLHYSRAHRSWLALFSTTMLWVSV